MKIDTDYLNSYGDEFNIQDVILDYESIKLDSYSELNINKNKPIYIVINEPISIVDIHALAIDKYNYEVDIEPDDLIYAYESPSTDVKVHNEIVIKIELSLFESEIKKLNLFCLNNTVRSIKVYHNNQYFGSNCTGLINFSIPSLYKVGNKWKMDNKLIKHKNVKTVVSNYMKDGFLI